MTEKALTHKRPSCMKKFYFGAPYYPEHWSADDMADDAQRMADAGFNCVRMAEFAWDRMEPKRGDFDFSLFDETIERMAKAGIETFMCTPTATPPRWFTKEHPETLRVDADGVTMQHGSRQHCCYSNETFREESRRITRAMAEHYADNKAVAAWQTDNEIYCHFSECHCPSCQENFRAFLKEKYGNIDALNAAWGTSFWALSFSDFCEIETPRNKRPTYANPSQLLDYYRYLSHVATMFQRDQVEILREVNPDWTIFHNGIYRHIDYRGDFVKDLDVFGYDCYPMFVDDPVTRRFNHAFHCDLTRSYSGNFIVPEHQSGPGGQGDYQLHTPEPGEIRRMSYTTTGRGCDSILYFRWRTCRFGQEMYWYGILDHDNIPRRRYDEIKTIGNEMKKVGPEVLGTHVHCDVAVATGDFDSLYGHDGYSLGLPKQRAFAELTHRYLMDQGLQVGCVHPADDLSDLKMYVIPHFEILDPAWMDNLTSYVQNGGTLVVGARTGCRDQNNHCLAEPLPGLMRELAGVTVEEIGRIRNPEFRPIRFALEHKSVLAEHFYEVLKPLDGTQELHHWHGRHLDGEVAATIRKVGKGQVIYVGTYLTEPVLQGLMPPLVEMSGLKRPFPEIPTTVEVLTRQNDKKRILFFINHAEDTATLPNVPEGTNLLTGEPTTRFHMLAPNDVLIVKQDL